MLGMCLLLHVYIIKKHKLSYMLSNRLLYCRHSMKVAVIDMGTNTFHLLLADVVSDGCTVLHRERRAVKIGENGINQGIITEGASARAIAAVKYYQLVIEANHIEKTFAIATSAIRNATNSEALIQTINKETGIDIKIISGMREAELILKGVRRALSMGDEKSLIVDIGGGSMEFIIADDSNTYWLKSFEIGSQRLVERFHRSDPISIHEIEALTKHFEVELDELMNLHELHRPKTLIGCSGTFDTLSDIYCAEHQINRNESIKEWPFPIEAFPGIMHKLTTANRAQRLAIPGMIEMRVDMIVVACILIDFLIKKLKFNEIRVSAYALKEGILYHIFDRFKNSV